jgi:hypothetical protein
VIELLRRARFEQQAYGAACTQLRQGQRASDTGQHGYPGARTPATDLADHGEAARMGHGYVQKQQIGLQAFGEGNRRDPILGLADDLDAVYRLEYEPHCVADDRVIIGN